MALPRNINHVVFGQYDIVTWFYSPYPEEFVPPGTLLPRLFVCPQCFKYTKDETAAGGHQVKGTSHRTIFLQSQALCKKQKEYPGRLVYTKKDIHIYQLDGRDDKVHSLLRTLAHFHVAHLSMSITFLQALPRPQNVVPRR